MSQRTFTLNYGKSNVSFKIPAGHLLHVETSRRPLHAVSSAARK